MKRRLMLLVAALLALATMTLPNTATSAEQTKYVPFLGRQVPVPVLDEVVRITDASFKDYGASGKQGARSVFGVDGSGVTIAIVDTGVSPAHEQLDGSKVIGGADFVGDGEFPECHGHGTHVASIAAGDGTGGSDAKFYQGVAPGASILNARVLDCLGRGTAETVISGIAWAVENGADIISMSLGMSGSNSAINDAVDLAVSQGVVVIASAGNKGPVLGTVGSPASAKSAIAVGASSEWSGGSREERSYGPYLAYFSSRGEGYGPTYPRKPDIVAPGVTVKAAEHPTTDGYLTMSGTSMSAPYVAGTVALMLEADPTLSPEQVRTILRETAFDAGPTSWDPDWGFGLVNTYSAVAQTLGIEGKDIFPPHYFSVVNKDGRTGQCTRGAYGACTVDIGTGSASFGPPVGPTKAKQPMAFTINAYTENVDLDAILVDLTNPGPRSEYPWSVVTASLPSSRPMRTEAFGTLPMTVGPSAPYRLFVGPSMPFDDRATFYGFGIDIFYR